MVYHLALTKLATSNGKQAFRLLIALVPHYSNNANYWLRLAECCFIAFNGECEEGSSSSTEDFYERSVENFRKHMEMLKEEGVCSHGIVPHTGCTLEFGEYACHRVRPSGAGAMTDKDF